MPTATANGKKFNFPDGTSPEQMGEAIDEYFGAEQSAPRETASTESRAETALPTAVAEGASALNRGSAAIPDFFIDAGNAATGLANKVPALKHAATALLEPILGQEENIPAVPRVQDTLEQATAGQFGQKNFMEPGLARDAIQTGGELIPSLVTGLTQPAKTAAKITEELAETSARGVSKGLRESAPTLEALGQRSDALYKQIDDLGVMFKQSSIAGLADDIERTLIKGGLDEKLTPKAAAFVQRLRADSQGPLTATQVDTLRKIAQGPANDVDAIGKATADARLGTMVIQKIDDFLTNPSQGALVGKADEVGPLFTKARGLVSQRKKGELLQEAFNKASLQASGFENGLRVQFRSILGSPTKRRGFNADELKAMRQVVEGGKVENAARVLGKFGISLDLSGGGFLAGITALGGIAAGGGTGGVLAGTAVALASGAKQVARVMTKNNAKLADATVRAGKNGRRIVAAYMKHTPKASRSPEQLAGLLLEGRVPLAQVKTLSGTRNNLVANASYAALVLSQVVPEEVESDSSPQPGAQ